MDAIVQPITTRTTLYVKKDGNDYMVSHLALGGKYAEYNKKENGSDCWISDGVPSGIADDTATDTAVVASLSVNSYTATKGSDKVPVADKITNVMCTDKYTASKKLTGALEALTTLKETSNEVVKFTEGLLNHIDIRFTHLMCLLKMHNVVVVVIAGNGKHNLGSNRARKQWELKEKEVSAYTDDDKALKSKTSDAFILATDYHETLNGKCYDIVIELINLWCKDLITAYGDRVTYGSIGIEQNKKSKNKGMSNDVIHVWGANINNFNKSNDESGSGQADAVRYNKAVVKTSNAAGAFGIITTPYGNWKTDFKNNNLMDKSFTQSSVGGSKPRNRTRSKKRRNSRKSK